MTDFADFITILGEELEKELSSKTGWGRNEVMRAFDKACVKALIRYAKEKNTPIT